MFRFSLACISFQHGDKSIIFGYEGPNDTAVQQPQFQRHICKIYTGVSTT